MSRSILALNLTFAAIGAQAAGSVRPVIVRPAGSAWTLPRVVYAVAMRRPDLALPPRFAEKSPPRPQRLPYGITRPYVFPPILN